MSLLLAAARLLPLSLAAPLGPPTVRLAVGAALVMLVTPMVMDAEASPSPSLFVVEAAIGLTLGLTLAALVAAAEAAGAILDGARRPAWLAAPRSGILRRAFVVVALAAFASVGGPRLWVEAVARSYRALPPGAVPHAASGAEFVIDTVAALALSAVELAAPLVAALVLGRVLAALVERFAPSVGALLGGFGAGSGAREAWGLGALALLLVGSLAALGATMEAGGRDLLAAALRLGS